MQTLSRSLIRRYNGLRAGVVQWQYRSFPSFGRGFDSHRPLHNSRCFNCPYTANLVESGLKMDRFGPQMDPAGFNWTPTICRRNRPVVQWPALGLDERDLTVEIGLSLRMELEGNAADRSDAFQHRK